MNALFTGIYGEKAGSALNTALGGRFYINMAPQNVAFPYCVYFLVSAEHEYDFSDEHEEFIIQFNLFDQNSNHSALALGVILGNLKTVYDDAALTVTGYRALKMTRDFVFSNNDTTTDPPVFGYSVQYTILLEKAK
ncbi:MAG: hypothetical protein GY841_12460 [FCB group bacterium]|nr:hypothetical protein [FCB group bacterium]